MPRMAFTSIHKIRLTPQIRSILSEGDPSSDVPHA
jgi:hypothetical protein